MWRWRPKPQPRRPLLFLVGDDPVRLGLIVSLARSGGNMTGINLFADEIAAKRLNLHICARPRRTSSPLLQDLIINTDRASST